MLSDDEIRDALFASGLHHVNRTVITRWKDGIDIDFPTREVIDFARAVERAAYERAAQECDTIQEAYSRMGIASPYGDRFADSIRALGRQHD